MKRLPWYVLIGLFAGTVGLAQNSAQTSSSAAQSGTVSIDQLGAQAKSGTSAAAVAKANNNAAGAAQIQSGSIIYANLDKSVDARKAKVGDPVIAKVEQSVLSKGKIVAPKGARILGRVTQVQARSKNQSQSQLGIVFDRVVLKDGSQIPVSFSIQAIGSGNLSAGLVQDADSSMAGSISNAGMPGRSGSPPMLGSAADAIGGVSSSAATAGDLTRAATGSTRLGTSTHVSASSHGMVGIPDVTMATQVGGSSQSTLLTSDKRNVKLESGDELVLRVQ